MAPASHVLRSGQRRALAIDQRTIVLDQAFECFPAQIEAIESGIAALEIRHDAQRLRVMIKSAGSGKAFVQRPLSSMTKWRMAEIMREGQRFGEIFVQTERTRERAGNLRHFNVCVSRVR